MSASDEHRWRDVLAGGRAPALLLVCLGSWLHAADTLVTVTIMPSVGAELGGYAYFGWAIAAFFTGCILAGATAGRLSELLGVRTATVGASLVYGLGCVISAMAPNMTLFLIGRLVQGIGGGWITGFGYVIIGMTFPERHIVKVLTVVSGVWGAATFVGPLFGGLFAEHGHWRGAFWAFAGQAAVFSAAAAVLLSRAGKQENAPGVPVLQVAVLTGAVGAIAVSGLMKGLGTTLALGALGIGLLLLALRIDGRARVQLLPRRAGDLRTAVGQGYAALFLLPGAGVVLAAYAPAILQVLRGLTPLEAGYVVAAEAFGWTVAAMAAAKAGRVWGDRLIAIGGVLIVLGLSAQAWAIVHAPLWAVVALVLLQGAGFGLSWGFISQRVLGALGDEERAIGSSALGAVFQAGCAAGAALAGAAANQSGFAAGPDAAAAMRAGFWVFASASPVALLGAWAAWKLSRPAPRPP